MASLVPNKTTNKASSQFQSEGNNNISKQPINQLTNHYLIHPIIITMPTATKNNSPAVDLDSFDMNIEEVINNGKFIVYD